MKLTEWQVVKLKEPKNTRTYENALHAWERTGTVTNKNFSGITCYLYDAYTWPDGKIGTYGGFNKGIYGKTIPLKDVKAVTIVDAINGYHTWAYNVNINDLSFATSGDFKVYATGTITLDTSTGIGMTIDSGNPSGHTYSYRILHGTSELAKGSIVDTYRVSLTESLKVKILEGMGGASSTDLTVEFTIRGHVNTTKRASTRVYAGNYGAPRTVNTPKMTFTNTRNGEGFLDELKFTLSYGGIEPGEGATLQSARLQIVGTTWGWNPSGSSSSFSGNINSVGPLPDMVGQAIKFNLRLINSRGQEVNYAIPESIVIRKYDGISIGSFRESARVGRSLALSASGTYSPNVGSTLKYKVTLNSGDTLIGSKNGDIITKDEVNKTWAISVAFGSLTFDKSYIANFTLEDALGNTVHSSVPIGGEAVALSLGRYGAGIGTLVDDDLKYDLQVGVNGIYSLGPIYSQGKEVGATAPADMFQVVTQVQYNGLTTSQKNDPSKIYLIKL